MALLCVYFQGYRMITGLVARPWCLMELCSKQEIINTVTDASTEATKIGLFSIPYSPPNCSNQHIA